MSKVDVEELVSAYLAIRTERDRVLKEYEAVDASLKTDMGQVEAAMLAVCNDLNADSVKTQYGTMMRQLKERYYSTDWDATYGFIREENAVELLERRIHQGNMKSFLAERENAGLPPGINIQREHVITVRKAS